MENYWKSALAKGGSKPKKRERENNIGYKKQVVQTRRVEEKKVQRFQRGTGAQIRAGGQHVGREVWSYRLCLAQQCSTQKISTSVAHQVRSSDRGLSTPGSIWVWGIPERRLWEKGGGGQGLTKCLELLRVWKMIDMLVGSFGNKLIKCISLLEMP